MEHDEIERVRGELLELEENIARCPQSSLRETYLIFFDLDEFFPTTIEEEENENATDILKSILSKVKKIIDLDWQEENEEYYKGFIISNILELLGHADPAIRMNVAKVVADVVKTHRITMYSDRYKVKVKS